MNLLKFFFPFFRLSFSIVEPTTAATLASAGISALGSIAGGLMGSNAEAEAYARRKKAYDAMIKRANEAQNAGEQAFYNNVNTLNPYLSVIGNDLRNNTNDVLNAGRGQIQAGLAQQGIRGGQAATQLNRGIGNITNQANQELNQMMYGDYANNRNLKAAYDQAKALAGLNAGLQQFQG